MDINDSTVETPGFEKDVLLSIPDFKLFKLNHIVVGTLFGGPFAGAYMIGQNFRKLGMYQEAWKIWAVMMGAMVLVFIPDFMGLDFQLPNLVYSAFFCSVAYYYAKHFQGYYIDNHESHHGVFFTGSKVILVVVINIIMFISLIAAALILADFEGFKEIFK